MSVLPDWLIAQYAVNQQMITPFVDHQVGDGVISYGLSSYGYDIRVGNTFQLFKPTYSDGGKEWHDVIVDPKRFDKRIVDDVTVNNGHVFTMPPHSFALASSVERLKIPRSVITVCLGKSTYARCGIIVNVTPFEPEWEGTVTIEISNTTPLPAVIYANEGIAQVLFFQADIECRQSYADKRGKYQNQIGITLPKV